MDQPTVRITVQTTLSVLQRLSRRTRTPADDLMAQMLKANEGRITEVVTELLASPRQPPTEDDITAALRRVGIDA